MSPYMELERVLKGESNLRFANLLDKTNFGRHWIFYNAKRAFLKALKILNKTNIEPKEKFDIKKIKDEAARLDIEVFDLGFGAYEFRRGDQVKRIKNDLKMDCESSFAMFVCGHKYLTYRLLERYGITNLPSYKVYAIDNIMETRNDFLNWGKKVVIKPCQGTSGGKGITVGIETIKDLNHAINEALLFDRKFLMEEFIEGDHYRILLFMGEFLGAIKRFPANVLGDGELNLRQLIDKENMKRSKDDTEEALHQITIDNDLKQNLKDKNMTLKFIPNKGEVVYLKNICNLYAGGEGEEISKKINIDIIDQCKKISDVMKINFTGVDIISKDITDNKFIINEVNTTPTFQVHYKIKNRDEKREVVQEFLKLMFGTNKRSC